MTRFGPESGPAEPPLASVLMPAFQAESTIAASLRSVRRQTEARWECLVIDDGSTDGTAGIVRSHAAEDPRIRLVPRSHAGVVAALNAGLADCGGRFVARMDADDLMHRRRLADQLAMFDAEPGLDALGCHVRLFPRSAVGPGYREYETWLNGIADEAAVARESFVECPLAHPTLVVRRRLLQELGYRERGWPEDYDLILRLITSGRRVGVLPLRRHAWRLSAERLSLNSLAYSPRRFIACKAHFLAGSFLAGADRYILWGHGGTGRALRRELEAKGKAASHIVEVHPGRLGNRIHGAPVVPPSKLPDLPRRPVVVSVAGARPRREIRGLMAEMGFRESRDFVCAA